MDYVRFASSSLLGPITNYHPFHTHPLLVSILLWIPSSLLKWSLKPLFWTVWKT